MYKGSCHCVKIRFEADLKCRYDQAQLLNMLQNTRLGVLLSSLRHLFYQWQRWLEGLSVRSRTVHHLFRQRCGIRPFGQGYLEDTGGNFYSVSLGCLDDANPQEPAHRSNTTMGSIIIGSHPPPKRGTFEDCRVNSLPDLQNRSKRWLG